MPKKAKEGRQTVRTQDRVEFQVLAEMIKRQRAKAKISQRKLSELIGRNNSYVGKFESGDAFPDFATALDMLIAVGFDPAIAIPELLTEAKKRRSKGR